MNLQRVIATLSPRGFDRIDTNHIINETPMPAEPTYTDDQLKAKFRKIYGRDPSGTEFSQFKRNYAKRPAKKQEDSE
jgi:hypothetical protein